MAEEDVLLRVADKDGDSVEVRRFGDGRVVFENRRARDGARVAVVVGWRDLGQLIQALAAVPPCDRCCGGGVLVLTDGLDGKPQEYAACDCDVGRYVASKRRATGSPPASSPPSPPPGACGPRP